MRPRLPVFCLALPHKVPRHSSNPIRIRSQQYESHDSEISQLPDTLADTLARPTQPELYSWSTLIKCGSQHLRMNHSDLINTGRWGIRTSMHLCSLKKITVSGIDSQLFDECIIYLLLSVYNINNNRTWGPVGGRTQSLPGKGTCKLRNSRVFAGVKPTPSLDFSPTVHIPVKHRSMHPFGWVSWHVVLPIQVDAQN